MIEVLIMIYVTQLIMNLKCKNNLPIVLNTPVYCFTSSVLKQAGPTFLVNLIGSSKITILRSLNGLNGYFGNLNFGWGIVSATLYLWSNSSIRSLLPNDTSN